MVKQGQFVASAGKGDRLLGLVNNCVDNRDEHVAPHRALHLRVDGAQYFCRGVFSPRYVAQVGLTNRHQNRSRNPLARNVCDGDADTVVIDCEDVI